MYYVYRFKNKDDQVIYVGKTCDMKQRMSQHFSSSGHLPEQCYLETRKIEFLKLETKTEMNMKELYYISKFNGKYNTMNKDEPIFIKGIEEGDVWREYNKERNASSENCMIAGLKHQIKELKEEKKKMKEKYFQELKECYSKLTAYYEMKEIIKCYEEKTGRKCKRKGYEYILY